MNVKNITYTQLSYSSMIVGNYSAYKIIRNLDRIKKNLCKNMEKIIRRQLDVPNIDNHDYRCIEKVNQHLY